MSRSKERNNEWKGLNWSQVLNETATGKNNCGKSFSGRIEVERHPYSSGVAA